MNSPFTAYQYGWSPKVPSVCKVVNMNFSFFKKKIIKADKWTTSAFFLCKSSCFCSFPLFPGMYSQPPHSRAQGETSHGNEKLEFGLQGKYLYRKATKRWMTYDNSNTLPSFVERWTSSWESSHPAWCGSHQEGMSRKTGRNYRGKGGLIATHKKKFEYFKILPTIRGSLSVFGWAWWWAVKLLVLLVPVMYTLWQISEDT